MIYLLLFIRKLKSVFIIIFNIMLTGYYFKNQTL
jgi:hypothetical protein